MIKKFSELKEGDEFIIDNDWAIKRSGTSYEDGNLKPFDYNAVSKKYGHIWQIDADEEVVLVNA